MRLRRLGASGLWVSRLGLGTLTWGRDTDPDDAADQFAAFRDAGGTLVDTADSFGDGEAETVLGRLLGHVPRHEVVIAAGVGGRTALGAGASRRHLLASLDASLTRLRTDHVDLWQVHVTGADAPLEETLAALDTAVASGRVRYTALAEAPAWLVGTAATYQRVVGRPPLAGAAVEYSLLARGPEREMLAAAGHHGLGLVARAALGRGVLAGKYRRGIPADSRGASSVWRDYVTPYLTPAASRIVDAVATAADGLGTSPLVVALAWVRDRPGVTAALVGARTAGQLAGVLAAETVELPPEIVSALDDVSRLP